MSFYKSVIYDRFLKCKGSDNFANMQIIYACQSYIASSTVGKKSKGGQEIQQENRMY